MRLRQRLITGLVTLLPLIVTLYLLGWVYTYSGAYIQAFLRLFGLEVPRAYQPLLPFVGLFLAAVLVYLVGTLAENYLGKRLIVSLERSLLLLPIVRDIYKAVQQIAHTLFGHQEVKFSRAAVIEYPRRGFTPSASWCKASGGGFPPCPRATPPSSCPQARCPQAAWWSWSPRRRSSPWRSAWRRPSSTWSPRASSSRKNPKAP